MLNLTACKPILRYGIVSLLAVAGSAVALQQNEQQQVIPFTLFQTGIVVDMTLGEAGSRPFVFDTGLSAHNLLSEDAAKTVDVSIKGRAGFTDSSGGRGQTPVGEIDNVSVGAATLGTQIFAIVPLPEALSQRADQPPIAGYTGPPLLENAVVCLDYSNQRLLRQPPAAFNDHGYARQRMPLNHGLPTVRVEIDGIEANLAVDTGADNGVHLFAEFVREHSLIERYPDLQRGEARSGGGNIVRTLTGRASEVRIGERLLENVPMLFMPQAFDPAWGIDGLLGYEFLSRLQPCLNRDAEIMFWKITNRRD